MRAPDIMLREAKVMARIRNIRCSSVVYGDKFEVLMDMEVLLDGEALDELGDELASYR
jgi:hypothetical protein